MIEMIVLEKLCSNEDESELSDDDNNNRGQIEGLYRSHCL